MAEEIVLNVSVNADPSIKEVKDLKQQFAEAEDAVFKLAGAGKQNTEEFRKAQLEAAALKQEVDNINTSLDDLKPQQRLAAFGKTVSGLSAGFAAATGAAALFGEESEDLEKTLVKIQAAMAFSEGIRGLADLTEGFKLLRVVMLANPIFLIATVLVAIGTAMFALKDKISILGKWFNLLGDIIGGVIDFFKDLSDAMGLSAFAAEDAARRTIAAQKEIEEAVESRYETEIRLAKAAGKATEELELEKLEQQRIAINLQLRALDELREARGELTEDELEQYKELQEAVVENSVQTTEILISEEKRRKEEAEQIRKEQAEARKQANQERVQAEMELQEDLDALTLTEDDLDKEIVKYREQTKAFKEELEKRRMFREEEEAKTELQRLELEEKRELEELEKRFDALASTEEFEQLKFDIEEGFRKKRQKAIDDAAKKEREKRFKYLDEQFNKQKEGIEAIQNLSNLAFTIRSKKAKAGSKEEAELAEKQFETNKKLQIAQAAINGAQAITAILSTPDPTLGVVTAVRIASAIAATASTIATISNTSFDSGVSSSVPPPASTTLPTLQAGDSISQSAVPLAQTGQTLLNPDGTVKQQEQQTPVVKAVVVETDITNSQNNVKDIEEKATFS